MRSAENGWRYANIGKTFTFYWLCASFSFERKKRTQETRQSEKAILSKRSPGKHCRFFPLRAIYNESEKDNTKESVP